MGLTIKTTETPITDPVEAAREMALSFISDLRSYGYDAERVEEITDREVLVDVDDMNAAAEAAAALMEAAISEAAIRQAVADNAID